MKSIIMNHDFEKPMRKVGERDYSEIQKDLSKLDNGMKNLLTEEQKIKYNLKY